MSVFYNGFRRGKGTFLGEKSSTKAATRGSKEARESKQQAGAQVAGSEEAAAENVREIKQGTAVESGGKSKKGGAQARSQKASSARGGDAEGGRAATARDRVTRSLASGGAQAKEALGQTEALTGIALGCFLAWVPMTFQSLNIVGDAGEPVLDTVYLVSILALLATQVFISVRHARCGRWSARRPVRAGAATVMTLSTLLLPLAAGSAGDGLPLGSFALGAFATGAAGVLSGVSSGIFLAQFGILVSKFSAKATAAIAAIGYILMSALFCVYSFFGPLESCLFAASMPVVSAFLRDLGASTAKGKAAISKQALPPQALPNNADDRRNLNHLTATLALSAALIGCANELARTLYIQMGIAGSGSGNYALIQAGGTLIVGLGATVIMLALVSMKTPKAPEYCYRIVLLFLVLGSLLLPTPLIYPIDVVCALCYQRRVVPVLRHHGMGAHLRHVSPIPHGQRAHVLAGPRRLDTWPHRGLAHGALRGALHAVRPSRSVCLRPDWRRVRHAHNHDVHRARPGIRREPAAYGQEAPFH